MYSLTEMIPDENRVHKCKLKTNLLVQDNMVCWNTTYDIILR